MSEYKGVDHPKDYMNPDWNEEDRVHNWRNYISVHMQNVWHGFSDYQKAVISENAKEQASSEEWD